MLWAHLGPEHYLLPQAWDCSIEDIAIHVATLSHSVTDCNLQDLQRPLRMAQRCARFLACKCGFSAHMFFQTGSEAGGIDALDEQHLQRHARLSQDRWPISFNAKIANRVLSDNNNPSCTSCSRLTALTWQRDWGSRFDCSPSTSQKTAAELSPKEETAPDKEAYRSQIGRFHLRTTSDMWLLSKKTGQYKSGPVEICPKSVSAGILLASPGALHTLVD